MEEQPATRAITSGRGASGRALAPALWASSVWQSTDMGDARRRATGTRTGEFYSRYSNPTVQSFEEAVAALEGAETALAFASGMGALTTTVLALCGKGDHIVAQRNLYSATLAFLQGPCARFGIDVTFRYCQLRSQCTGRGERHAGAHTATVRGTIAGKDDGVGARRRGDGERLDHARAARANVERESGKAQGKPQHE